MIQHKRFVMGETCLDLSTEYIYMDYVESYIHEAQYIIEQKIKTDPFFGFTLDSYTDSSYDHPMIRNMCRSSMRASVGPMASVASAVNLYLIEHLMELGCKKVIANNGGDVAILSKKQVIVGIGDSSGVMISVSSREDHPIGVCSSSGITGHSLSFGNSDICTVISDDITLADACATRLGNMVIS